MALRQQRPGGQELPATFISLPRRARRHCPQSLDWWAGRRFRSVRLAAFKPCHPGSAALSAAERYWVRRGSL